MSKVSDAVDVLSAEIDTLRVSVDAAIAVLNPAEDAAQAARIDELAGALTGMRADIDAVLAPAPEPEPTV
jgi:outer membrane murein-binding lipoprotein Lpp